MGKSTQWSSSLLFEFENKYAFWGVENFRKSKITVFGMVKEIHTVSYYWRHMLSHIYFFSVETCIIICSENLCNLQTSRSCWPVPIAVLLFIIIFVWFQYQLNASISLNFDQFAFRKKHRINGDLLEIVVIQCQSNANIVIQCYASELINCWRQLSLKHCCLWHWIFAVNYRFSRWITPYNL